MVGIPPLQRSKVIEFGSYVSAELRIEETCAEICQHRFELD